jgi:hypothetical protein
VKSGERPLIVWTRETGIFAVAVEDRRCPPIWKAARGRVVIITSRVGERMPCLRAGMVVLRAGKRVASQEKKKQNVATKANWIRVSVAGLGKALRIDLEEVLVRALEKYQIMQRVYSNIIHQQLQSMYYIWWRDYEQ